MVLQEPAITVSSDVLTPRQVEIMRAIASGADRPQVAAMLRIAPKTLKVQLSAAYHRLGVDREVAAFAALGWLRVPA